MLLLYFYSLIVEADYHLTGDYLLARSPASIIGSYFTSPVKGKSMNTVYIEKNRKSRERLRKLLDTITDEELELVIYKEGWTVAVALGHLAFWDERRASLARRWKENGVEASDISGLDMHTVNDALVPVFLAMPVRKTVELCLAAAEKVDGELESLSPEMAKEIEALNDRYALDRAFHRDMHLDEIDSMLRGRK